MGWISATAGAPNCKMYVCLGFDGDSEIERAPATIRQKTNVQLGRRDAILAIPEEICSPINFGQILRYGLGFSPGLEEVAMMHSLWRAPTSRWQRPVAVPFPERGGPRNIPAGLAAPSQRWARVCRPSSLHPLGPCTRNESGYWDRL